MNITSLHLKIIKIIKNCKKVSQEELANSLGLNSFTLKNYLKEIELYLEFNKNERIIKDIIDEIREDKKIVFKLKKDQIMNKQEKIYYLIFLFLTEKVVNLTSVSKEIGVDKRGLNYYLIEIKKLFINYNLILKSTRNGIVLIGGNYNKGILLYIILFKLTLEKIFLPKELKRILYRYILKSNLKSNLNYKKGYRKICEEFSDIISEYTTHVFSNIYLAFNNFPKNNPIKNIDSKQMLKYKPKLIEKNKFLKVIYLIKETPLGELDIIFLDYIFLNIFYCSYRATNFRKEIVRKAQDIKPYILELTQLENINNNEYLSVVCPWIEYAYIRQKFEIFDFFHFLIGLNISYSDKLKKLEKNINKHVPTSLRFELFFFSCIFKEKRSNMKEYILIYDKIPKRLIKHVAMNIQKTYSINIKNIVNIKEFYSEKKYYNEEIITIEKLSLKKPYEVKNYKIPI